VVEQIHETVRGLLPASIALPTRLRRLCEEFPEWTRNLSERLGERSLHGNTVTQVQRIATAMDAAFPDAAIEFECAEAAILEPVHVKDRHVVAAAMAVQADAIVTFNLADFAVAHLKEHLQIEVILEFASENPIPNALYWESAHLVAYPSTGGSASTSTESLPTESPRPTNSVIYEHHFASARAIWPSPPVGNRLKRLKFAALFDLAVW
jgi:hypothetical protein